MNLPHSVSYILSCWGKEGGRCSYAQGVSWVKGFQDARKTGRSTRLGILTLAIVIPFRFPY